MKASKGNLDFIVIGAQKAGTTSLFEYLRRHPELCLPANKEAPYFSEEKARARGWDEYLERAFPGADPTLKWGTITPHYMYGGIINSGPAAVTGDDHSNELTVPLRIREHLPNVRLVAILRDPVVRAFSHYQMEAMKGSERRSFDEAIDDLLRPDELMYSRQHPEEFNSYVTWGEYGRILSGYFDVFPREQILVLFTDELERAPDVLLRGILEFLGVGADVLPDNVGKRYREGRTGRRFQRLSPYGMQRAVTHNSATRALWHGMPYGARRWVDRRFEHVAYLVELWNRRGTSDAVEPSPATLTRLREHFAQEAELLVSLVDVALPWQTG